MSYRTWHDPPRKGDEEPFPGSPDDMMNTIAALRDRNAALEGICRSAGLCMSCLYGAPDLIVGCTDCLNTGWDGGDPHSQIEVLEARVAQLEAALRSLAEGTKWKSIDKDNMEFEGRINCYQLDKARAALKDAPQ